MLILGNHYLNIQHWTDQGGGVEDVAFFCFTRKGDEVFECTTAVFDVWEAGSVNAAEIEARKAATKHARELVQASKDRKRAKDEKTRKYNEEYFGKPSGKDMI